LAEAEGIRIIYEYHANTLTDNAAAARQLLERVDHADVKTYWQPPRYSAVDDNLAALETIQPWLWGVHVFQWDRETGERQSLAAGERDWPRYLQQAHRCERDFFVLLEFVADDAPENFLRDAETLKKWLAVLHADASADAAPSAAADGE
jgi:sugar phosphate isomerase/epimerase